LIRNLPTVGRVSPDLETSPRWWSPTVSTDDERLYARAGFGGSAGIGDRIALLVIDVQYRTVGRRRVPIDEAMAEYPTACGDRGWAAIDNIRPLLSAARASDVLVAFPYVAPKTATTAGGFRAKSPSLASPDLAAYDFVTEAVPREGELLVAKDHPSAFFGTGLVTSLVQAGIDTVLIAGCTTSGCVRASAVDAFSFGFRVGVVADAVYDRTDAAHQASLFDLSSKYADVLSTADAVAALVRQGARSA
jgi:maleamate amidohydrolase